MKMIEKVKNASLSKMEEVQELLNYLTWEKGNEAFKIMQTSPITGVKELVVYGLDMEIAEEIDGTFIMFYDMLDDIMKNGFVIMDCFLEQIKKVRTYKNQAMHHVINIDFIKGENIVIEELTLYN